MLHIRRRARHRARLDAGTPYALFSISGPLLRTLPTNRLAGIIRIPSDS